ncbi:hypothetical protein FB451DRAFT_1434779 [Mycena latifolia]|nr:hypothetical protein FB451DRAFT_1434779 [Mycena latifolia]
MSLPSRYVPLDDPFNSRSCSLLKAIRYRKTIETVDFKHIQAALYAILLRRHHITALRACLLIFTVTRGRLVPHDLQLQAGIAAANGKECFVIARTGWGKTLCITIPILLSPDRVSITISPLKRLQMMQVSDFLKKFSIVTVASNEDTPNCPVLWAVARVAVDECHNIYAVGSSVNGRKPFRPAYGALAHLRIRLGTTTAWSFLSATIPTHIFKHIHDTLAIGPSPTIIRVSPKRPNLIYATHTLVGGRGNMRNLDLIIPRKFHPPMRLPQLVVFHGNKSEAAVARQHKDSLLPEALQNLGIDAYQSFADPEGVSLILHATAGAGEGLDIPGINGIIIYGRAGCSTEADAFCVHMIEPWVSEIDTSQMPIDPNDPDHPLSDTALTKKNPTKQECTGRASVHHATSPECERVLKAAYYQDNSPEALEYTGRWCCDSSTHLGNTFSLQKLFLGAVYEESPPPLSGPAQPKRKRNIYRPTKDRPALEEHLIQWRTQMHTRFTLRAIRPPTFILDSTAIKKLTMARASSITSPDNITSLLNQSPEWADMWVDSLFKLISEYAPEDEEDDNSEEEKSEPKRRKS